jgi:ABC-type sugar transport system substrate-binding protein
MLLHRRKQGQHHLRARPHPDHGWTAQAGAYADAKVKAINDAGRHKAVYMAASSGEEQVDQVQTILANGDAAGVVFFALEDSAKAGQEALIEKTIPFISFDRIIEGPTSPPSSTRRATTGSVARASRTGSTEGMERAMSWSPSSATTAPSARAARKGSSSS